MKISKNLTFQLKMLSNLCGCHRENEDMIKNFKLKNNRKEAVVVDQEDSVVVDDDEKKKIR